MGFTPRKVCIGLLTKSAGRKGKSLHTWIGESCDPTQWEEVEPKKEPGKFLGPQEVSNLQDSTSPEVAFQDPQVTLNPFLPHLLPT